MPDAVIVRWRGLPSGSVAMAMYDRVHARVRTLIDSGEFPGLVSHLCAETPDGMLMVDVWEDASVWHALFSDPRATEDFHRAGVPEPTSVEVFPVHTLERAGV